MLVALHNPANLPLKIANIAVPHGNLAIQRFDAELGAMVEAPADVLCDVQEEELYPSKTVNNCQLYLRHPVESNSLGFFVVRYDPTVDLAIPVFSDFSQEMVIESDDLALKYLPDYAGEGVYFELTDKDAGSKKIVGFDLRYW